MANIYWGRVVKFFEAEVAENTLWMEWNEHFGVRWNGIKNLEWVGKFFESGTEKKSGEECQKKL